MIAAAKAGAGAGTGETFLRASRSIGGMSPAARAVIGLAFLGLVALVSRASRIDAVLPCIDEQFYLLVADRMWHGALPYVDIWDRKPIGLFLLYAALRPLSSDGIVAYQIGALVFAVATAFVIARLGRRLGSQTAALAAGALYLFYLPVVGGIGGQSPVFYNLFVALAALAAVKAAEAEAHRPVASYGLLAMLLLGIAIQVKYTAFVEGVGFGLYFVGLSWSRAHRVAATLGLATALVATALLPTALAYAYFAARGFGPEFLQANFFSIFHTMQEPPGRGATSLDFLRLTIVKMAPLLIVTALALALHLRSWNSSRWAPPLLSWCVFAMVGFSIIGRFYAHYALPTLVPLSLFAIPLLESPLVGGLVLAVAYFYAGLFPDLPRAQGNAYVAQLVDVLQPYAAHGCLYLRDGPPIAYLLTRSCLPTPYVFPEHLTTMMEARATNATTSMARLLAGRPSAIALSDHPPRRVVNEETQRLLADALASNYRLVTILAEPNGVDHASIYARADLVPAAGISRAPGSSTPR